MPRCQGEYGYNIWYQNEFLEFLEKPLKHFKVVLEENGLKTTSVEHSGSGGA